MATSASDSAWAAANYERLWPSCLPVSLGWEAWSNVQDWAREFQQYSYTVKLISPQLVKPYVKGNKNDSRDAEAICEEEKLMSRIARAVIVGVSCLLTMKISACTQETQNELSRSLQNWTGTDGVLDIYADDKLVMRFIKIDKLTTAHGTQDNVLRPYRFGYGYVDENFNFKVDDGEKKVYFEISDYSTRYVFYENYKD